MCLADDACTIHVCLFVEDMIMSMTLRKVISSVEPKFFIWAMWSPGVPGVVPQGKKWYKKYHLVKIQNGRIKIFCM